jgi:plastocyanin
MHRAVVWTFAGAIVLVLLATPIAVAAGGCVNHGLANDGAASTIAIKDCSFSPTVTRVPAGATVTWKNVDYLPHVVSGVGWGSVNGYASTDASMLQPGATFAQTFTTPGLYPYTCYLHPGMSGVLIVGDADASAASAAVSEPVAVPVASAFAKAAPPSDTAWSYLLIALFGVIAIGGYGIALVRRF